MARSIPDFGMKPRQCRSVHCCESMNRNASAATVGSVLSHQTPSERVLSIIYQKWQPPDASGSTQTSRDESKHLAGNETVLGRYDVRNRIKIFPRVIFENRPRPRIVAIAKSSRIDLLNRSRLAARIREKKAGWRKISNVDCPRKKRLNEAAGCILNLHESDRNSGGGPDRNRRSTATTSAPL